jgi:DNA integrity scanning protein DisA with diadenylate cyclase activity
LASKSAVRILPEYAVEICRAMDILSARRLGGLIIIERKDRLDSLVGGGFAFDSEIKAEVVAALFEKTSSVHDGAIIVRYGRIARVKAVLPVSSNRGIPSHMGTRHRSAIGITENSDAIALVVSEERQEQSIAFRGCLLKAGSSKDLMKLLFKALKGRKLN